MLKRNNVVWRLLRRNVSVSQIVGYALANLVGLSIVLTAIQFYNDINQVWEEEDSFFSKDYLIISKRVSGVNTLFGNTAFSERDIEDIKSQPWTRKVGKFTAAAFDVRASINLGGHGVSSALFLESIPDDFFDIKPDDWGFTPGQREVPIILSKDYLALYNFGFATTRGLPQLSESTIGKVPLKLYLSRASDNATEVYAARIVGFSSRMNTIAVPQDFLEWANDRYAIDKNKMPSRLIIEVNSPGNPDITSYLEQNNYEVAGDKVDNGKASYFLSIITAVVVSVGIIICILAFFILMLSIYLLLQKNKEKLHDLMLLGYSPSQVARYYYQLVGLVNVGVLAFAIIILLVATMLWRAPLDELGVEGASLLPSIIIGVVIVGIITIGNFVAITRN
ncbi:MAG: ABC transporter permease, partial [Muribaculaceae bacterium]|nr:ABC transporter permease [Muribaculaceae bacterium]